MPSASTSVANDFVLETGQARVKLPDRDSLTKLLNAVSGGNEFMTHLVIHALQVGGGTLALTSMPGGDGDYEGDLETIGGWKPGLVISMTTEVEMLQCRALSFGRDIQSRASRWVHLPIEDFGAPSVDINQRWPQVSAAARQALSGGGRVLVHCRGGCGRSGMIVLRLMVECGENADAALLRLRNLRPCAVETDGQMHWATLPIGAMTAT